MNRSARVVWIGSVFSTIIIAAVAGLVVYFTAFRSNTDPNSPAGGTTSETNPSDSTPQPNPSAAASATPSALIYSNGSDHLSHAVPNSKYLSVDLDDDGKQEVHLDGSRSHTHYYKEGPPVINGRLVKFAWFDKKTRKHLSSDARPLLDFPVGMTEVGLTVLDNSGDSHTAYTRVTVKPPIFDGAYCFYYPPSSPPGSITLSDSQQQNPFPKFSEESDIQFSSPSKFSTAIGPAFQMRCVYFITLDAEVEYKFDVQHSGAIRLYANDNVVLEATSTAKKSSSVSPRLGAGKHAIQLLYSTPTSGDPHLVLGKGKSAIKYDVSKLPPVLTDMDPQTSLLEGGGEVRIEGINLVNDLSVEIDGKKLQIDTERSSDSLVYVKLPAASSEKIVEVIARNKGGMSNALKFHYKIDGKPPIKFGESILEMQGGGQFSVQLITGIKYGPDHRFYVSAIDNRVHSFATDSKLRVHDICHGAALGTGMSILGMAFNPLDTEVKLYVSGSVLHWHQKNKLDHPMAWANGEIILVKKDSGGGCLGKSGESVITGLPVTNHDHGVNGLEFDNDGKLHIQVGGFTNAGVVHTSTPTDGAKFAGKLGGLGPNPLSGASLIADVNKPGFNGKITYSDSNPDVAEQTGGDVEVFSPGFRNSFGITIHSNGYLYATDNGASPDFGDRSLSCTTHEKLEGGNLADELLKVVHGKYAGHPNRNRGRKDPRQCVFRAPDETSDEFYEGPVATFESSTDGIIEYTANTFQGQLKGDLLCSKFTTDESTGKVFRVQLNEDGNARSSPSELWLSSGLSMTMSPYGDLLMARVFKKEILVLSPVTRPGVLPEFRAVLPFRGPSAGGNWVMVTGERLGAGATATFDGVGCSATEAVSDDKRSFMCQVPAARKAGAKVKVGLKFDDSRLDVAPAEGTFVDYMYMNL